MPRGYVDFEFDLPRFLLAGLAEQLDGIGSARLSAPNLIDIPDAQGVYQLFLGHRLVYIGKTDAADGLNGRLSRHLTHVQHRLNLDPDLVRFKAARVFVFTAVDLESLLIQHYREMASVAGVGDVLIWNNSGFGNNDPGRERDTTGYREGHFDRMYPIDIDRELALDAAGSMSAAAALGLLRACLPYTFRFQTGRSRSRSPHPDFGLATVSLTEGAPYTARSFIEQVVSLLPSGWRALKLPGRIVLYKNDNRDYPPEVEEIARSH